MFGNVNCISSGKIVATKVCRIHSLVLLQGKQLETVIEVFKVTGQAGWANARTDSLSSRDTSCVCHFHYPVFVVRSLTCNAVQELQ